MSATATATFDGRGAMSTADASPSELTGIEVELANCPINVAHVPAATALRARSRDIPNPGPRSFNHMSAVTPYSPESTHDVFMLVQEPSPPISTLTSSPKPVDDFCGYCGFQECPCETVDWGLAWADARANARGAAIAA